MISSRYKFIYLHVPKTGGNAVQSILLPHSDDEKFVLDFQDGVDRFGIRGAVTPEKHALLRDYYAVMGTEVARYHVALTVRHPYDRLVSHYFSPHRWRDPDDPSRSIPPVFDEAAFVRTARTLKPMLAFLEVPAPIHAGTTVLRFERLADDLNAFAARLIPDLRVVLPHVNKSAAPQELGQWVRNSRALRNAVEPYLREDLAAFDYTL